MTVTTIHKIFISQLSAGVGLDTLTTERTCGS